jgi:hypothetical protein
MSEEREQQEQPAGPGMRFFAELTGREVDAAAADPRGTLGAGLQALAGELHTVALGWASDDPARREQAHRRATELRDRLDRHHHAAEGNDASSAARDRFEARLGGALQELVERLRRLDDEHGGAERGEGHGTS